LDEQGKLSFTAISGSEIQLYFLKLSAELTVCIFFLSLQGWPKPALQGNKNSV